MFYANSETILNNDRFFSPYIVESYPHQKEKSFNNYLRKILQVYLNSTFRGHGNVFGEGTENGKDANRERGGDEK